MTVREQKAFIHTAVFSAGCSLGKNTFVVLLLELSETTQADRFARPLQARPDMKVSVFTL